MPSSNPKRSDAKTKPPGEKKPRKPSGRRPVDIDPEKVKTMASYGCTNEEIAAVLGCSADTLERRCKKQLHEGRNARNGMLRVRQFKLAEKSAAMAIFLGKNYLGQRDIVKYETMTDAELIARAREAGIDLGAIGAAAPPSEGKDTDHDA